METPSHLQRALPYDPTCLPHMRRLPGTVPLGDRPWLLPDEAFAGQMALRDRLVAESRGRVIAGLPGSEAAVAELHALVLEEISGQPGYDIAERVIRRPDGGEVPRDAPLLDQLARLVQEDLCVMEAQGDTHVLTAATLLFPAHWTLAQKIGRPLMGIHDPVAVYDAEVGRRVQRLFDGCAQSDRSGASTCMGRTTTGCMCRCWKATRSRNASCGRLMSGPRGRCSGGCRKPGRWCSRSRLTSSRRKARPPG